MNPLQSARTSRDKRFDGKFFVAVKTTKIFCRNICRVKLPKEENVEYFDFAAQAQAAGYRPCLRCRPESAPHSWAWQGTETTVKRALKLIREDLSQDLESITARLGISDRYLRKLFEQHLAISPKQFQLTEKLLFAKSLLHQTPLTIEQVAQSSGFSSSRRLQENMKKGFFLTPSEIRKQTEQSATSLRVFLSYREPYNWQHIRDFLAFRAIEPIEHVTDHSYHKKFTWNGIKGAFTATINYEKSGFDVEIELTDMRVLYQVIDNIRRVLDLDADIAEIENKLLSSGIPKNQLNTGIRLPGVWSVFEAGVRAVLGQQVSVKAAINHVKHLVTEIKGEYADAFPLPEEVANTDLSFLKMPERRKASLSELARLCAEPEGELNLESWLAIKGIGPWTVAYAEMRGLSMPDVWLNSDLVIKKMLSKYQIDELQVRPWRSYLTIQLWSYA